MKIIRTKKEIEKKIKEIVKNSDNFTSDNYGSEACDNGYFELQYEEINTEQTLRNFLGWLIKK